MDPWKLAALPRDRPLPIQDGYVPFTCAICGATQDTYAWRVVLPERAGRACPNCAADAGFVIRG